MKLFNNTNIISQEMIQPQINDSIKDDLIKEFDKLIKLADDQSTKLVSSVSFFKRKESIKIIEKVDSLIFKRFGLDVKHISGEDIGYAIFTAPPVNVNILSGEVTDIMTELEDTLGKSNCDSGYCPNETTDDNAKKSSKIKDYFVDTKSVMYRTYKSFLALEETLNTKGIKIDLKKAKISNLPKDYKIFILVDFFALINKFKLTAGEIAAALIHEVGHAFTHLEYSYRTVENTSVLLDTMKRNLNKGKTNSEVLKLIYEDVLDGEEDLSKSNEQVAAVKVLNKYMYRTANMSSDDRHSFTDSEQLADQFSNRIGLGEDLVTALHKLNSYSIVKMDSENIVITVGWIVFICIMVMVALPAILTYVITILTLTLAVGGDNSNSTTYDTNKQRYKRIRNDIVRILRTSSLDKKVIKEMLKNLEVIDNVINNIGNDSSLLSALSDIILPWNSKVSSFQKLEEMLENMSENELHVSSNKLRTI